MSKLELQDDHRCFACGPDNLEGLRLKWDIEGSTMTTFFISEQKYQGWKGIVHGGILATLLDEAMARLAGALYGDALTAEMTVRYIAPAHIGELLYVKGEVISLSRKLIQMKSVIRRENESGPLIAHATGKIIKVL